MGRAGRLGQTGPVPLPELPPIRLPRRTIGRREFDFATQIVVMGIVNRTPDSFFDGGRTYGLESAIAAALAADRSGAGWVDIGGVPFSPDTLDLGADEEIDRVVPVVAAVAEASDIVVSVDTWRAEVAAASIAAGAAVINDTSGLRDPELAAVVAASAATLVITHSLAAPHMHLQRPTYDDVVTDVRAFLAERVERAVALGVPEERIVIDPGHDLNKNTRHSLELTRRFAEIASTRPTDAGRCVQQGLRRRGDRAGQGGQAGPLDRGGHRLCARRGPDPADARRRRLGRRRDHDRMHPGFREPAYARP